MAEQSQWATNVGGILSGVFGGNGAADEIAAIGSLGKGQKVPDVTASDIPTPSGSGISGLLIFGGIVVAIILAFMVLKK